MAISSIYSKARAWAILHLVG